MSVPLTWERAPSDVCAAALANLSQCWPGRLLALVRAWSPHEAVRVLFNERKDAKVREALGLDIGNLPAAWRRELKALDPAAIAARLFAEGVDVWTYGTASYPELLADDIRPPGVLFVRCEGYGVAALTNRRVAIVGTRRCTAYGRNVATQLGRDLSDAGVSVVSGLAVGIDGAAHEGALEGATPPIGVVGSGLDVVYPRRHSALWRSVGQRGMLLAEAPLGARPDPWRFPARNRIIAGLAELLVVVESAHAGGSQITVDAAAARGVDVMAVPGPVGSAASAGTNQLLVDGAAPVLGADEVLVALGMSTAKRSAVTSMRLFEPLSREATKVLALLDFVPTPTERIVNAAGLTTGRVMCALEELAAAKQAAGGGGWWSRVP